MSFDYPQSDASIKADQNFYRIRAPISIVTNTKVATAENFSIGDLAPVRSPVVALAVGPDSDVFRYEVIYPDSLAAGGVNTALLTPANPLFLPAGVDLSTKYNGTEQLKAIFVRALDWMAQSGQVLLPVIDLIAYTRTPPTIYPMVRNPKRATMPLPLVVAPAATTANIPISGRQEVSLRLRLSAALAAATVSWTIEGRKLYAYGGGVPLVSSFVLQGSTAVPGASPQLFTDGLFTYTPQQHGYYDVLRVTIASDAAHDPTAADTAYQDVYLDVEMRD